MITPSKSNFGHSVYERIRNQAAESNKEFQYALTRYANERFLYRLSISKFFPLFILKGASLLLAWAGEDYRVTRDADFLGLIDENAHEVESILSELAKIDTYDIDGVSFLNDSIKLTAIREKRSLGGVRANVSCSIYTAVIPLQIDIGFGDALRSNPVLLEFPSILKMPPPRILSYSRYSYAAEKLEAIVYLGIANSRMKDFYDLWLLIKLFEFDGPAVAESVIATFERRKTPIPADTPLAFSDEFLMDSTKQSQWRAFANKLIPLGKAPSFFECLKSVAKFSQPIFRAANRGTEFNMKWPKSGPWQAIG